MISQFTLYIPVGVCVWRVDSFLIGGECWVGEMSVWYSKWNRSLRPFSLILENRGKVMWPDILVNANAQVDLLQNSLYVWFPQFQGCTNKQFHYVIFWNLSLILFISISVVFFSFKIDVCVLYVFIKCWTQNIHNLQIFSERNIFGCL